MQVNQYSGNYRIIASGDTFLFEPFGDLSISIEDTDGTQISIVMRFVNNQEHEHYIEANIEDDSLIITCHNFDDLNSGLKKPVHIADADGKAVFILFSSEYIGNKNQGTRSVKYTIFLEN